MQDEQSAGLIDKYKMLAVVDAGRSFANNEVSGDSNVVNNDFFYRAVRLCQHGEERVMPSIGGLPHSVAVR